MRRQVRGAWQPTPSPDKLAGLFVVYSGTILLLLLCTAIVAGALILWKRRQRAESDRPVSILNLKSLTFASKEPFYLLLVWLLSHNLLPFLLSQVLTSFYRPALYDCWLYCFLPAHCQGVSTAFVSTSGAEYCGCQFARFNPGRFISLLSTGQQRAAGVMRQPTSTRSLNPVIWLLSMRGFYCIPILTITRSGTI